MRVIIVADGLDDHARQEISVTIARRQRPYFKPFDNTWILWDREHKPAEWLEIVRSAVGSTVPQARFLILREGAWAAHGPNFMLDAIQRTWK